MNNFLNFFRKLYSANSGLSSKRFMGVWLITIYTVLTVWIIINKVDITPTQASLLHDLLYVGAALLGLGIFDMMKQSITKNTNKNEETS